MSSTTTVKQPESKARVFILYTGGGTIGMAPCDQADPRCPLEPKSFEQLKTHLPCLKELENKIEFGEASLDESLDSSNIEKGHWLKMVKMIRNVYGDCDGFVILHGTDTMAYTATALAFIFENLEDKQSIIAVLAA